MTNVISLWILYIYYIGRRISIRYVLYQCSRRNAYDILTSCALMLGNNRNVSGKEWSHSFYMPLPAACFLKSHGESCCMRKVTRLQCGKFGGMLVDSTWWCRPVASVVVLLRCGNSFESPGLPSRHHNSTVLIFGSFGSDWLFGRFWMD